MYLRRPNCFGWSCAGPRARAAEHVVHWDHTQVGIPVAFAREATDDVSTAALYRSISLFVAVGLLEIVWAGGLTERSRTADVVGALLCVGGVAVIMYWPRGLGRDLYGSV